jgi:hypothetical protein
LECRKDGAADYWRGFSHHAGLSGALQGINGMNKNTINIVIGIAVVGILWYLSEENPTLAFLAIGGIAYLLFANGIVHV